MANKVRCLEPRRRSSAASHRSIVGAVAATAEAATGRAEAASGATAAAAKATFCSKGTSTYMDLLKVPGTTQGSFSYSYPCTVLLIKDTDAC
jgi:hypothetical protein